MSHQRDSIAVMYGPPESFFREDLLQEEDIPRIQVVAAVLVDEASAAPISEPAARPPRILACRRGYGGWQGWWEFPGGKIEPGESDQEALRREIREEMETEIDILRYYDTIHYRYPDFLMTMHLYLCRLQGNAFVLHDHSEARWLGREELASVQWLPADTELIDRWISNGFDF